MYFKTLLNYTEEQYSFVECAYGTLVPSMSLRLDCIVIEA